MIDGFKKFIARGNMVDMAVGVVMGAAVTAVVNSVVDGIINPLVASIFGKPDLSKTLIDHHQLGGGELGDLVRLRAQRAPQLPAHRTRCVLLHRRTDQQAA